MPLNFPHNPSTGDTHTASGREWKFDGTSWRLQGNGNYTLPIATAGALGGVKVGSGLSIDSVTGILTANVQSGANVTTDDTPPGSPSDGDLWWKSSTGQLKIYYQDIDSSQWVDAAGGGGGSGIALTDLSVTQNSASGSGQLSYDNSTGVFSYTPPVIGGGSGGTASSDPIGTIVMWSGASNAIPTGYQLCDGSASATAELQAIRANVPDLRDKFVVGASVNNAVDSTGGSADAIVVTHDHGTGGVNGGTIHAVRRGSDAMIDAISHEVSANDAHYDTTSVTDPAGSSGINANLPPYYSLCYIIKNAASLAVSQVNSDWSATGGVTEILNKPTIPAAQIRSDWTQTDTTSPDYIRNKPTLFSGSYTDLTNKPTIPSALGDLADVSNGPPNTGNILTWNGSGWIPDAPSNVVGNGIVTANVKDFGALGDDNNDDTNAINSAIASLANNASQYEDGGIVYFPPGIYRISSPLQLSSSGTSNDPLNEHSITLKGSSTHFPLATGAHGGSILRSTSTTANLIEITNVTSISVQNLSVDTSVSKTNGVAIRCESTTGIQGVTIDQFYVRGFPKGIEIHGYSNCMIKNSEIRELPEVASLGSAETHGILLTQGSDERQDQIRLENVIVDAKDVIVAEDYHDYANGIILKKYCNSVWIKDCSFLNCYNGIWFSSELNHGSDNNLDGAFHRVLNSDVDHNKNHGIIVDGGDCIWFENCYASSNLQMGFYMGVNFDGTVWINNIDCRGNGSHGIHVNANAAGTFINSARCYNNGVKDSGNKSGVYVLDTAYNVRIIGGQFGGDNEGFNTGAQQHGIKFLGTDHKQSLISGCNVLGNSADGISFDSTALNDPSYYNFITCCAGTTLNNVT